MTDHIARPDPEHTLRAPRTNPQHFPGITDHSTLVDLAMRMALQLWAERRPARPGAGDPAED